MLSRSIWMKPRRMPTTPRCFPFERRCFWALCSHWTPLVSGSAAVFLPTTYYFSMCSPFFFIRRLSCLDGCWEKKLPESSQMASLLWEASFSSFWLLSGFYRKTRIQLDTGFSLFGDFLKIFPAFFADRTNKIVRQAICLHRITANLAAEFFLSGRFGCSLHLIGGSFRRRQPLFHRVVIGIRHAGGAAQHLAVRHLGQKQQVRATAGALPRQER